MDNRYRQEEADRFIKRFDEVGQDLALRVYTSQLLGREPGLVLHGGGNTSVKSTAVDALGTEVEVLYVKGSGWDLASIEPAGFPACRIAHLQKLCALPELSDEMMVKELRGQMMDPQSPTPSVEALLHAFLPEKFVDHTHSDAILALVDQPTSKARIQDLYGDDVLFVPYVMPGFVLARQVAELWGAFRLARGADPGLMVLDKHGIFTWGATAQDSYARMIDAVSAAERALWNPPSSKGGAEKASPKPVAERSPKPSQRPTIGEPSPATMAGIGPTLRGALHARSQKPWLLSWRATPTILSFVSRRDLDVVSQVGCMTPDHVIRTKPWPLLMSALHADSAVVAQKKIRDALDAYGEKYDTYFDQGCQARGVAPQKLDPLPRLCLVANVGAIGIGKSKREAEIALDIFEHTVGVVEATTAQDGYQPVSMLDLFDVEYWSLEQAKLKKGSAAGPLGRRVALVTGAASGIGLATARAFLKAGAHVLLSDVADDSLDVAARELRQEFGDAVAAAPCDVTDQSQVQQLVDHTAFTFGGLDIVVSNAGNAWTGRLAEADGQQALEPFARTQPVEPSARGKGGGRAHATPGLGRHVVVQCVQERPQPRAQIRSLRRGQGGALVADATIRRRLRSRRDSSQRDQRRSGAHRVVHLGDAGVARQGPRCCGRRLLSGQPPQSGDDRRRCRPGLCVPGPGRGHDWDGHYGRWRQCGRISSLNPPFANKVWGRDLSLDTPVWPSG